MGGINKYPIYEILIKFVRDRNPDRNYEKDSWSIKGLRKNRLRDVLHKRTMFRSDVSDDELNDFAQLIWKNSRKQLPNPSKPKFEIQLVDREEWCLGWFFHWTFDVGQSDSEVLESFENFLHRKGVGLNYSYGYPAYEYSSRNKDSYCAMGAEDRWRWHGIKDTKFGNDSENKTPPPCRCPVCKEQGVIRIFH